MVEITYPLVLLVIIVPYLIYYFWPMKEPVHKPMKLISVPLVKAREARMSLSITILAAFSFIFLALAVSRPIYLPDAIPVKQENYHIMLAVDMSLSMSVKDIKVGQEYETRLDVHKQQLKEFIRIRNQDQFGIIVFGEKAFIMSPITSDHNLLTSFVDELDTNLAGALTSLGDAIILSAQTLSSAPNDNKVLILLTDGKDTAGNIKIDDAITYALNHEMKIYTIGYGSDNKEVNESLDIPTLQKIAEDTGGKFYRATSERSLRHVYESINATEQKKATITYYQPRVEIYYIPLLISLLLSFAIAFIVRRHYD